MQWFLWFLSMTYYQNTLLWKAKSAKYHILAVIIGQASSWYFTRFIPLAASSFLSFNRECEIYILHSKLSVWPLSHLQFQLSKCPSKCLSSSLHSINIKIKHSSGLFAGELDIDIYLLMYFILFNTTTNLHFFHVTAPPVTGKVQACNGSCRDSRAGWDCRRLLLMLHFINLYHHQLQGYMLIH